MPQTALPSPAPRWFSTLSWAAYLACSWTWCIGMFLPVLLVRDFGFWGYVAFAAPNIVGAAGMGWVLKTRASASRIVRRHTVMTMSFSMVTVAFQAFFLASLLTSSPVRGFAALPSWSILPLAIGVGLLALPWRGRLFGVLAWIISVGLLLVTMAQGGIDFTDVTSLGPMETGPATSSDVVWLAPVCIFGFMLCPYLDLTFCRARESLPAGQARAAFTIGFGVLFATMIAGTLGYSIAGIMGLVDGEIVSSRVRLLLGAHIGLQLLFTMLVHSAEMLAPAREATRQRLFWPWIALIIGMSVALALGHMEYRGLFVWEICYRAFMAFYGLVFPAYVWLCMIPTRLERHTSVPNRRKRRVFLISVCLAAPFYWMGFVERETIWLGPGLLIVLVARLAVRSAFPRARSAGSA